MITGRARIAGVLGWPVAHSRSPRLHNYWLEKYGIDGAYVPFPVHPDHLGTALRALPLLGMAGVNLTVPHKESALAALDSVDPLAATLGAVNTVVVDTKGALRGLNSDVDGFRASLTQALPGAVLKGPATILGAGGAARAVCAALLGLGIREIRLVNRSEERAARLAHALAPLGIAFTLFPWSACPAALDGATLLVNATSLGMTGSAALDIDLAPLPRGAPVADIVYVPLETALLAAARRRGHPCIDGLGMLLHQARTGFAAWFGVDPEVTPALRAHVLADLERS